MSQTPIRSVCVFCASSRKAHNSYYKAATLLGETMAVHGITIKCGGGANGLMGKMTDGALSENGTVIGIIPDFMQKLEWGHPGISKLIVVPSMHERKVLMREDTDAAIALPGGTGTLEELVEVITLKRLGIYSKPIVMVNTGNFYNHFLDFIDKMIEERFMDSRHRQMFSVVNTPEEVITAIETAPPWDSEARHFAVV